MWGRGGLRSLIGTVGDTRGFVRERGQGCIFFLRNFDDGGGGLRSGGGVLQLLVVL